MKRTVRESWGRSPSILFASLLVMVVTSGCGSSDDGASGLLAGGTSSAPIEVRHDATEIQSWLASSSIPVSVAGPIADTSYHTRTTAASTHKLVVWPAGGGEPVEFTSHPIVAEFYHLGRALLVTEGPEDNQRYHNFFEPIRWSVIPR